jgi:hypothetical protein
MYILNAGAAAEEQRADTLTAEQSVVLGQLGFFAYTARMVSLWPDARRRVPRRAAALVHN